ncbi:hypothetical protein S58_61670 [Bradyrhizobium oligotrophicum S58]|uniref:Uncharacterized protein n=1 Tax=Bradyrhizobium oligotrophicum S58 TaxID=1245469 RepID=M4ZF81_9BRAD|nr:hypothetical protein [Bradyrhizobium oligotrophicum]BAM92141.1 hypothetical protein S58_61670 [Bradyrhizobium oligotrophicum S58]
MSNFSWLWCIALVASALAPAKAQDQKTLGPCSPAIGGVQGNVSVTCLTDAHRIRIAKLVARIECDENRCDVRELKKFIEANCERVVSLDVSIYKLGHSKIYSEKFGNFLSLPRLAITFDEDRQRVKFQSNSLFNFYGYYFLVCQYNLDNTFSEGGAIHLTWIDRRDIALSDKYETR